MATPRLGRRSSSQNGLARRPQSGAPRSGEGAPRGPRVQKAILTAPVDRVVTTASWPHPSLDVGRGAPLFVLTPRVSPGQSIIMADVAQLGGRAREDQRADRAVTTAAAAVRDGGGAGPESLRIVARRSPAGWRTSSRATPRRAKLASVAPVVNTTSVRSAPMKSATALRAFSTAIAASAPPEWGEFALPA